MNAEVLTARLQIAAARHKAETERKTQLAKAAKAAAAAAAKN